MKDTKKCIKVIDMCYWVGLRQELLIFSQRVSRMTTKMEKEKTKDCSYKKKKQGQETNITFSLWEK